MQKPAKIINLRQEVWHCIKKGNYFDTRHATDRKTERNISRTEILYVLQHGRHEKSKDRFQERYNAWNYAIRGKTVDKRDLRVIISFDENNMLIITAIDLDIYYG